MKKMIRVWLAAVFILTGCLGSEPSDPLAGWLAAAALDAEETPEELYAAALKEETLVVYSTSTRMMDVAKSFQEHYPGLTVRVEHAREPELYEMLAKNYETGNFNCDLIASADGQGIAVNEFLPQNILVKYVPFDIRDKMLPGDNEEMLSYTGESPVLQYNDVYYSEPPVNNWWELTEEKWRGMVCMPNPTKSTTTMGFLKMIIRNNETMAASYEDFYGEPLEVPGGENAGTVFIRRLVGNGVLIVNSSDEAAEIVGTPGLSSPMLAIAISSKTRLRGLGYELLNHYGMEPFCGIYTPSAIMIAGGAPNINSAKLYIRWLLGEADGQGEGYQPYLQNGAWSVRSDVTDDTGVRKNELNLLQLDRLYLYESQEAFLEFWSGLMAERDSSAGDSSAKSQSASNES